MKTRHPVSPPKASPLPRFTHTPSSSLFSVPSSQIAGGRRLCFRFVFHKTEPKRSLGEMRNGRMPFSERLRIREGCAHHLSTQLSGTADVVSSSSVSPLRRKGSALRVARSDRSTFATCPYPPICEDRVIIFASVSFLVCDESLIAPAVIHVRCRCHRCSPWSRKRCQRGHERRLVLGPRRSAP